MICEKCRDAGWIFSVDEDGYTVASRCTCQQAEQSMKRIERLGLKDVAESKTLESYQANAPWQRNILAKAKVYDYNGWFYIGGQTGCGKTHICTALTINWIKMEHSAEYMLWRQDATRIKRFVTDSEKYNQAISRYMSTSLLYIDDLFKGKVTEADVNLAFELLDARYRMNLPTIISSEKLLSEIGDIDESLSGRIHERASVVLNIGLDKNKNWRLA